MFSALSLRRGGVVWLCWCAGCAGGLLAIAHASGAGCVRWCAGWCSGRGAGCVWFLLVVFIWGVLRAGCVAGWLRVVVIPKTPARGVCVAFRAIRRAGVLAGLRAWGVALCYVRCVLPHQRRRGGCGGGLGWLKLFRGAGGWRGANVWCKHSISEKKKKTKNLKNEKIDLRRFKAIKIFRWYSWSFFILDALRTALKCLKLNFRLVGVVVILVKVGFLDKIRVKIDFSV